MMSECICTPPNVLHLGCPIHGPAYEDYRQRMMRPSLTDDFQQSEYFKNMGRKEMKSKIPNRKMLRKARKAKKNGNTNHHI